jgi:hypothetical protein
MSADNDAADSGAPAAVSEIERATGAVLYLLVRIASGRGCRHMVRAVEHHLTLLATHRDSGEHLRRVATVLGGEWRETLDDAERCASVAADPSRRYH